MEPDEVTAMWDERYRQACLWGVDPNRFLVEHCSGLSPRRVLDLGCGQGRNAVWLALEGHAVTAVDRSEVAVGQTLALAAEAEVEVEGLVADAATWDVERDAYDLVVLAYVQAPPEERRAIHATAVKALRPGGRVFLVAHHLDNLEHGTGGPPMPEVLYTEEDLAGDFEGLDVLRNESVRRRVDKDGATADAVDVLLVASKPPEKGEGSDA